MAQYSKKLKVVGIEWLQKNVLAGFSDGEIAASEHLKALQSVVQRLEDTATSLAARDLDLHDSMEVFGLTKSESRPWTLDDREIYDPPEALVALAREIAYVTEGSTQNEAYTRCVLNNILVCCLAQEKRLAHQTASSQLAPESSSRSSTPQSDPARLVLHFETPLKYPVKYKDQSRIVTGFADYSLWHSQESMGTNLVVVEAKRSGALKEAEGQIVAYMGIVHRTRKEEGRRNAVVYGVSTDGDVFRFWRIDNSSQLSRSRMYEWEEDEREITSFMRYIIRAAIESSPSTSPVKAGAKRELRLDIFSKPTRQGVFDFGIGSLSLDEDLSDEDVEVVDLPDLPSPSKRIKRDTVEVRLRP